MMTRRILAIVAAFALSIAGHLLVFVGGYDLLMRSQQLAETVVNPPSLFAVIVGLVLIGAAAFTVVISSAGVIALGALHVLYGLLMCVLPLSFDVRPPTFQLTILLRNLNMGMGDGLLFHFMLGTGLLTGVILLVAGLQARRRALRANPTAILVSIAVSILGFIGIFVAITGGFLIYRAMVQRFTGQIELGGLALLLLGSVLVAATVITLRWSSAGVITLGSVVLVVSIAWPALSTPIFVAVSELSRDLANALVYVGGSGLLAIVGVALVAVGVGTSVRARRGAREVAPAYAPGPMDVPAPGTDPQVV